MIAPLFSDYDRWKLATPWDDMPEEDEDAMHNALVATEGERDQALEDLAALRKEFGWHVFADEKPPLGALVIATDGEVRWMDKYDPGISDVLCLNQVLKARIGTHWHPVLPVPEPEIQF